MKWEHKCSLEWIQERQKYLCASEIKQLIPFTKTGRDRKITDMNRYSVWANKQKILTEEDCFSIGTAARGHILEPYAINEFNKYAEATGLSIHLYHWDDIVVSHDSILGYSPDAANVAPQPFVTIMDSTHSDSEYAKVIGEVKCYTSEKHIETMLTPNNEREERWQIATAMAVDCHIDTAYLILFNPSLKKFNLGVFKYTREELEEEIKIIKQVEKDWIKFLDNLSINNESIVTTKDKEEDIIKLIKQENRFNP